MTAKIGHPKGKRNRHAFRFKIGADDNQRTITCWAKVIPAKRHVYLPLKAAHVQKSISLKGIGNTQTCTMAVCADQEKSSFPHRVEGGYIDWFYSRAFVVSRLDKNGLPCECYEYQHSDQIAQMNDTKGGQRKLLAQLTESGDRIIHLRPVRRYDVHTRRSPPKGVGDGSRTKVLSRGAKLRFAVAQLGGVAG